MEEVKVIDMTTPQEFEAEVNKYLKQGWELSSSSCGFVNSEQYDFCGSYQAVLVRRIHRAINE